MLGTNGVLEYSRSSGYYVCVFGAFEGEGTDEAGIGPAYWRIAAGYYCGQVSVYYPFCTLMD